MPPFNGRIFAVGSICKLTSVPSVPIPTDNEIWSAASSVPRTTSDLAAVSVMSDPVPRAANVPFSAQLWPAWNTIEPAFVSSAPV